MFALVISKMCKFNKYGDTRIDPCMREFVSWLKNKHKTVLCCCGHGKYPMTVIVKEISGIPRTIKFIEIFSGKVLREIKNPNDKDPKKFYKRDEMGHYYIPEISEPNFKTKIIRRKDGASIIRRPRIRRTIKRG